MRDDKRKLLQEHLRDESTRQKFIFSIQCEECGFVQRSRPVTFTKAGTWPATEGKRLIYDKLYQREKTAALAKALAQLAMQVNVCPICGRLVCDRCFMICDDLDMCCTCAQQLKEQGESVAKD